MKKLFALIAVILTFLFISGCTLISDVGNILTSFKGLNSADLLSESLSPDETYSLAGANGEGFSIFFIDVGQADSAVVMCDGESMLVDGGNRTDSSRVVSVLRKLGISHIKAVVCSHAHEDHVGGLAGPLSVFAVDSVFAPKEKADTKAYMNFIKAVEKKNITIQNPSFGEKMYVGSALVTFITPAEFKQTGNINLNNTSLVIKIEYGDTSLLLTGDAEKEIEDAIIETGVDLSANLLKVAHHGSENSTSYRFLREVMPEYAIISVGKDNSYGHPSEAVLSRLSDADSVVMRTDLLGDIAVTSDGNKLSVSDY
ncbi:MAG: ComEC family competence protein [Firmicutes bacterium ADurb.Bin300]|nr:MAG: ComEC family competence protein [Firmicutes bacterium ADurb.Bin300]